MRNLKTYLLLITSIVSFQSISQTNTGSKKRFEKILHLKLGSCLNFENKPLSQDLIKYGYTSTQDCSFNPYGTISFETKFTNEFGLNIEGGFLQFRHRMSHPVYKEITLLSNIPHFNILPTFYIYNTRIMAGFGYYKYYNASTNSFFKSYFLAGEGYAIYSKMEVMQTFQLKSQELSISLAYLGVSRKYDSAVQLALGLVFSLSLIPLLSNSFFQ